jgi:predicted  nucleic acid-binding Zn-ribbon protein
MKEAKTSAPAKSAPSSSVSQASDEYWAAVLQSKADLEMQLGNVRNELKTTLLNNEQMEKEKEALDLELKSLKRETEDVRRQIEYDKKMADRQMDYERKKMEQQLADNKRIMDRLSQDLVTEKNDKMKIQEMLNTLKSENRALTHEIENLSSRKVDLEERLKQVQDDKVMVERKFREMETVLADNISKVNELKTKLESGPRSTATEAQKLAAPASRKQAVELPPIVVRPQATVGVGAAAPGRHILAVNKEGNFVIIDLGEDAGVKMGDTFTVYRDGKKIALLEAIRVSKTVTACDIKKQVLPITTADTFK